MLKVSTNIDTNIKMIHDNLSIDKSFDLVERKITVGGRDTVIYYINGFIKDNIMEEILETFFELSKETMNSFKDITQFASYEIPHVAVEKDDDINSSIYKLLTGQTILYIDGFDAFIVLDLRVYPGHDASEPEKEKTLRGSREAFIEKLVFDSAFLRRHIRDPRLVCEIHTIGSISKTDVCVVYLDGVADEKVHKLIVDSLQKVDIKALTVGDQTLIDVMCQKNWLNPFPKVRYTERPDVAAAHIIEGKFAVIVDNSPNVLILPTGIFDFLQSANDYYFPLFTGNYLRLVRNLILLSTILVTPIYLLFVNGDIPAPVYLDFLRPQDKFYIPLGIQFIILEFAVDTLNLASINTPNTLGSSLSFIGGLIIGDYAIKTGWFTTQSVLYMAIVALGGFAQTSIEMNYAFKFMRIIIIILTSAFGLYGFIGGLIFMLITMFTTKTIAGDSYFYPLYPLNLKDLKRVLFRGRTSNKVQK